MRAGHRPRASAPRARRRVFARARSSHPTRVGSTTSYGSRAPPHEPSRSPHALSGLLERRAIEAVTLDERPQVLAIHTGGARGLREVAVVDAQELGEIAALERVDRLLLDLAERPRDVDAHAGCGRGARQRDIGRLDEWASGDDHRLVDLVLELAHVAGEVVRGEPLE